MDRKRFAEAYSRRPSAAFFRSLGSDALVQTMKPFETWDERLGDLMYESLSGDSREAADPELLMRSYTRHMKEDNADIARDRMYDAIASADIDDKPAAYSKALNQHNFHVMSQSAIAVWSEMTSDFEMVASDRELTVRMAMFALARHSIDYALWRDNLASIHQGHEYFSDENKLARDTVNGIMTEIDANIVLLDMMRTDRNLVVVAAPSRFEHSTPSTNADFIAYDRSTDEAAGIQVKTRVTDQHREMYDSDRIVLISGDEDLGGKVWTRTERGRSETKFVPWPGMIAADVLKNIPLHGKKNTGYEFFDTKYLLNLRRLAGTLLRPAYDDRKVISGTLKSSKQKVIKKLMPYLRQESEDEAMA